MNVNYYRDELISEIVMKFEETQEQFIFQTISDFTSNVYQIEIDKQELIDQSNVFFLYNSTDCRQTWCFYINSF